MDSFSRDNGTGKVNLFYQIVIMLPVHEREDLRSGDRTHGRCITDTGIVVDENKTAVKVPFLVTYHCYRTVKIHDLTKIMPVRVRDYKKRIGCFISGNDRNESGFFEPVDQVQCNACLHGYLRAPEHEECRSRGCFGFT